MTLWGYLKKGVVPRGGFVSIIVKPSEGGEPQSRNSFKTLRAKGTLISEPRIFYPLRDAIFPTREREKGLLKEKPSTKAIFPFSRGKDRISQGVENRGSLISVPLALSEISQKSSLHIFSGSSSLFFGKCVAIFMKFVTISEG